MPNLDTLLAFTPEGAQSTPIPPISAHVLVTDTLDSSASFVLIHFLRAANAANKTARSTVANGKGKAKDVRVIWLGCNADGIGHLRNVARKSGVQIDVEAQRGAFSYIDVNAIATSSSLPSDADLSGLSLSDISEQPPNLLKDLYQKIKEELVRSFADDQLEDWTSDTLIIIDDLSSLSWTLDHSDAFGRPVDVAAQISSWMQALSGLALKYRASLVTLCHADATSAGKHVASDSVDESLFRSLVRTADVWVEVKELVSGRARDCDGEITVHALVRPSLARNIDSLSSPASSNLPHNLPPLSAFRLETPCPSRSKAVLYRIAPDGQGGALGGASAGSNTGRVQVWARGTGRGFL